MTSCISVQFPQLANLAVVWVGMAEGATREIFYILAQDARQTQYLLLQVSPSTLTELMRMPAGPHTFLAVEEMAPGLLVFLLVFLAPDHTREFRLLRFHTSTGRTEISDMNAEGPTDDGSWAEVQLLKGCPVFLQRRRYMTPRILIVQEVREETLVYPEVLTLDGFTMMARTGPHLLCWNAKEFSLYEMSEGGLQRRGAGRVSETLEAEVQGAFTNPPLACVLTPDLRWLALVYPSTIACCRLSDAELSLDQWVFMPKWAHRSEGGSLHAWAIPGNAFLLALSPVQYRSHQGPPAHLSVFVLSLEARWTLQEVLSTSDTPEPARICERSTQEPNILVVSSREIHQVTEEGGLPASFCVLNVDVPVQLLLVHLTQRGDSWEAVVTLGLGGGRVLARDAEEEVQREQWPGEFQEQLLRALRTDPHKAVVRQLVFEEVRLTLHRLDLRRLQALILGRLAVQRALAAQRATLREAFSAPRAHVRE